MKNCCNSIREHGTNGINLEKHAIVSNGKLKFHQDATACYICRKRFSKKSFVKIKIIK